jgi:hypothetical protein
MIATLLLRVTCRGLRELINREENKDFLSLSEHVFT